MIKDITNPKFNMSNVPAEQRVDCLDQLIDARNNGFITANESLSIATDQWYIQVKANELK